ncbi:hypothetical protein QUF80_01860 [Desulfococcaceae bacterium HSG8]|nr:hypothetical protein [Desulfococcaceae bacterium HSG8]
MKKAIVFTVFVLFSFLSIGTLFAADWTDGTGGTIYYNDGNVGIGINAPETKLHVVSTESGSIIAQSSTLGGESNYFEPNYPTLIVYRGSSSRGASVAIGNQTNKFYLYGDHGSFKIYTPSQEAVLSINSDGKLLLNSGEAGAIVEQSSSLGGVTNYFEPNYPTFTVYRGSSSRGASVAIGNQTGKFYLYGDHGRFRIYSPSEEMVFVTNSDGNVGIGETNPQSKLAVNGTVTAKEVIVSTTGWSDYVLKDDYNLMPLNELEQDIKKNGHLPDIPSAEEVKKNGVSVGEMQAKLLQKVEELTLYMIELKKENEVLKQQVASLQKSAE